jgi:hypothetical protein
VEALLTPLDGLRRAAYATLGPFAGRWARHREVRVLLLGALGLAISLACALGAPFWSLAIGPILFGVPHVLADLRYLVLRPGLHRRWPLVVCGLPLLMLGTLRNEVAWGVLAALACTIVSRGLFARKLACGLLLAPLALCCFAWPRVAALVFAHAHNLIAMLLFVAWRKHSLWAPRAVGLLGAVVALGFLAGAFDWALLAAPASPSGIAGLRYHLAVLAPAAAEPWGLRLVGLFAFAQAVHYALWLRVIPEQARERGPRSFVSSYRALVAECGVAVVWLSLLAAAVVIAWALGDLGDARSGYLRAAVFHGHIELIACALLLVEGRAVLGTSEPTKFGGMRTCVGS